MSPSTQKRASTARKLPAAASALALVILAAAPALADAPPAPPGAPPPTGTFAPPAAPPGAPPPTGTFLPPPAASPPPGSAPLSPVFPAAPNPPAEGAGASGDPFWSVGPRVDVAPRVDDAEDLFRRKKRLIIAGATIFGLSYYASLLGSSIGVTRNTRGSKEYIAGLFPLGGPFVAAVYRAVPNDPQPADYAGMAAYLGMGALQLLGAGLFYAGLRAPTGRAPDPCKKEISGLLAPCSSVSLSLQPMVTPTYAGAGLTGSF